MATTLQCITRVLLIAAAAVGIWWVIDLAADNPAAAADRHGRLQGHGWGHERPDHDRRGHVRPAKPPRPMLPPKPDELQTPPAPEPEPTAEPTPPPVESTPVLDVPLTPIVAPLPDLPPTPELPAEPTPPVVEDPAAEPTTEPASAPAQYAHPAPAANWHTHNPPVRVVHAAQVDNRQPARAAQPAPPLALRHPAPCPPVAPCPDLGVAAVPFKPTGPDGATLILATVPDGATASPAPGLARRAGDMHLPAGRSDHPDPRPA